MLIIYFLTVSKINPFGKRSARLVDGVITHKYYYTPEGQLLAVADKDGNLKKSFIYATKSHIPDYFVDEFNKRFKIITDQLGSVRLVINTETGEVKQKLLHDEFGNILVDTNKDFTPFGFAGGIYDSSTGLVRFGARDYDPKIGRWTSKDPISFDGGDSNLYGYVLQDPINYIDSDGNFAIPLFLPALIPVIVDAAIVTGSILGSSYLVDKLINAFSKQKGERGKTRHESGTDNPYKKYRPHPTDSSKIRYKDPHTGKWKIKDKPADFDKQCEIKK